MVDVGEVDAGIGRHAVGGDLPQQDAEGPHVGLGAERVVGEPLGCRPLDGELGARVCRVRVVAHQPRQPEVRHLHEVVLAHQAVARRQVPATHEILGHNKLGAGCRVRSPTTLVW